MKTLALILFLLITPHAMAEDNTTEEVYTRGVRTGVHLALRVLNYLEKSAIKNRSDSEALYLEMAQGVITNFIFGFTEEELLETVEQAVDGQEYYGDRYVIHPNPMVEAYWTALTLLHLQRK